jgi:fructan beta-fructosidase
MNAGWMNGPAELIHTGERYHLFYPCNPTESTRVTTHLGHAVSTDMLHWEELPPALGPDSLGAIASGCVVLDEENSSGFGTTDNPPLIAIYTYHNYETEAAGGEEIESQGLAFSLDGGDTWTKYDGNPVIPGARHFRDPKVSRDDETGEWRMTVAQNGRVSFYRSSDLRQWRPTGSFGTQIGSEYDVWESPDLMKMRVAGTDDERWVLTTGIGMGETGEWGTGYFTGTLEDDNFTPDQTDPLWIDYGFDNYAGTTSALPDGRTVYIGCMNNWEYAAEVPTEGWKGSLTLPRELTLESLRGEYVLSQRPVGEIGMLQGRRTELSDITVVQDIEREGLHRVKTKVAVTPSEITVKFRTDELGTIGFAERFGIRIGNESGESVTIGYDSFNRLLYVDRGASSTVKFSDSFKHTHLFPCDIEGSEALELHLVLDRGSLELFTVDGKIAMTDTFYPTGRFDLLDIFAENGRVTAESVSVTGLKSVRESSGGVK